MNIEDQIRAKAHWKIRVWITGRTRSRKGFTVTIGIIGDTTCRTFHARTKKEALAILLAEVRCLPQLQLRILPTL